MPSPRLWLLRAAQGRDKPPAMAGYLSPGAYFYAEEQEYLQAYEDVLERYKGRAAPPPQSSLSPAAACPGRTRGVGGGQVVPSPPPVWGETRLVPGPLRGVSVRGTAAGGFRDKNKKRRLSSPAGETQSLALQNSLFADRVVYVSMCVWI